MSTQAWGPLLVLCAGTVLLWASAGAEPIPALRRPSDVAPPATLTRKPTTGLRMGSFQVRFEKTKLDDVRRAAGFVGVIEHEGDASESVYWLCYTVPGPQYSARIWIIAHGEMGGPEHLVTGVHAVRRASSISPASSCPLLPRALRPVSFEGGLWLNVSVQNLTAKLGAPSAKEAGWWSYAYAGKAPGLYQGAPVEYDVLSLFEAKVERGKVVAIIASQVTSY